MSVSVIIRLTVFGNSCAVVDFVDRIDAQQQSAANSYQGWRTPCYGGERPEWARSCHARTSHRRHAPLHVAGKYSHVVVSTVQPI